MSGAGCGWNSIVSVLDHCTCLSSTFNVWELFRFTCNVNLKKGNGSTVGPVAPAFQSWFAPEYSSCFISVMSLDLSVCSFDSFMSSGPLRGPNNFYVYMNHSSTQDEVAQRKTGLSHPVIYC